VEKSKSNVIMILVNGGAMMSIQRALNQEIITARRINSQSHHLLAIGIAIRKKVIVISNVQKANKHVSQHVTERHANGNMEEKSSVIIHVISIRKTNVLNLVVVNTLTAATPNRIVGVN
jgi:hypothetical protein